MVEPLLPLFQMHHYW